MDKTTGPLNKQVAVVTGAARGIGAAIAQELARLDAHVVLTARDTERLDAVRLRIEEAGGSAVSLPCDLRQAEAIEAFGVQVEKQFGRCDILVNCAGVAMIGKPLHELAPEDWTTTFQVNLRAPYLMIRAFAPMMIRASYGHIINISSLAGKNPLPNGAAYAASKWGLNGLTYSVAEELRPHKIRVSVVAPGSVNTEFGQTARGGAGSDPEKAARKIQPQDVADVVALLVTQKPNSFVSEVLMRPTAKP
jgi:NAD(P)-dependent dehydrogenase (short-subunit alcohol dehydrogenase family)